MTRNDADELLQKLTYKMHRRGLTYLDFYESANAGEYREDRNHLIDIILEFTQLCCDCEDIE